MIELAKTAGIVVPNSRARKVFYSGCAKYLNPDLHLHPVPFPLMVFRFAFLNREDSKGIQIAMNAAKYAEKAEISKVPRGAQVRQEASWSSEGLPYVLMIRLQLAASVAGSAANTTRCSS